MIWDPVAGHRLQHTRAKHAHTRQHTPTPQVSGYSVQNSYVRSPPETTRVTPVQIEKSVDASLKRLGVDHIDLLQIHVRSVLLSGWLNFN